MAKTASTGGPLSLVGALELAGFALQLLDVSLHCSSRFALADGRGLFVKLSAAYFTEYPSFFTRTLEASQCNVERFVLFDSYVRHGSTCFQ